MYHSTLSENAPVQDQAFSFHSLVWQPIRRRWKLIVGAGFAGLLLALLSQAMQTPKFTARAVVAPASVGSQEIAGQLGKLGGLAAMAGINVGTEEVSEFAKFKYLLQSDRLGDYQARDSEILHLVFDDRWNSVERRWEKPNTVVQAAKDLLWPVFGLPAWLPPDGRELAQKYQEQLTLKELLDSGMLQLTYKDENPERAARILGYIVRDANELVRQDAARHANEKAIYLRDQLAKTNNAEYKGNLASLLSREEQTLMLVNVDLPYAADIVEPISIPNIPSSQRPIFFGMIGIFLGICFGVAASVLLNAINRPLDS